MDAIMYTVKQHQHQHQHKTPLNHTVVPPPRVVDVQNRNPRPAHRADQPHRTVRVHSVVHHRPRDRRVCGSVRQRRGRCRPHYQRGRLDRSSQGQWPRHRRA
eukprot:2587803-Rhodomonas_salina.1